MESFCFDLTSFPMFYWNPLEIMIFDRKEKCKQYRSPPISKIHSIWNFPTNLFEQKWILCNIKIKFFVAFLFLHLHQVYDLNKAKAQHLPKKSKSILRNNHTNITWMMNLTVSLEVSQEWMDRKANQLFGGNSHFYDLSPPFNFCFINPIARSTHFDVAKNIYQKYFLFFPLPLPFIIFTTSIDFYASLTHLFWCF